MFDWFLLLFVGAVGLYWQSASRMGELAILCARRECKKYDVQLLDHTVHTIHLSMSRDHNDQWPSMDRLVNRVSWLFSVIA